MEERAKREAVEFFKKYGQGRQPVIDGNYYRPGANPTENSIHGWLPTKTASEYIGYTVWQLIALSEEGEIRRRKYNGNQFEYNISDMDAYLLKQQNGDA